MKNYILNGAMRFDQNQEGSIYYIGVNTEHYTLDQWRICGGTLGAGRLTAQRESIDFNGFDYCLQLASTTQQTVLNSTDNLHIEYPIEGSRIASWKFGTSNAESLTLSFWVVATQAGDYSICLMNGVNTRSYVTSFNVPTASAWTYVTVTIPGDTVGTWNVSECVFGAKVIWSLGVGSSATAPTSEIWNSAAYWNKAGTNQLIQYPANNCLYLTGVQLELGTSATDYEHRDLSEELKDLQRYLFKTFPKGTPISNAAGTAGSLCYIAQNTGIAANGVHLTYPTRMEASANITTYSTSSGTSNWYNSSTGDSGVPSILNASSDGCYVYNPQVAGDTKGQLISIHLVADARLGGP